MEMFPNIINHQLGEKVPNQNQAFKGPETEAARGC